MFIVRRLLSAGLRTTLPQLQENVKRVQSLATPLLSIESSVLNTSRKASRFVSLNMKQPQGQNKKGEEEYIVVAELTIIDRTEIETKLSTQTGFKGRDQLDMTYTCPICDSLNQKTVDKWCYENSSVIARCGGCNDHQVLADHCRQYEPNQKYKGDQFTAELLMHKMYPQNFPKELQDIVDLYYSK